MCKAKSIAFLIIVAAAWDLQEQSAARSSQAMDFLSLWTAYSFGFLSVMQPKADESATQDSKSSEGSQRNGYQHGRIRTWKSRKTLPSSEQREKKRKFKLPFVFTARPADVAEALERGAPLQTLHKERHKKLDDSQGWCQ